MKRQLHITQDGSHTLYVPDLHDHYHSTYGAIRESSHIYIDRGLRAVDEGKDQVNILEVGFGTGLNALLTWQECEVNKINVHYIAIEPFPVEPDQVLHLNYPSFLDSLDAGLIYEKLHKTEWGRSVGLSDYMEITRIKAKIQDAAFADDFFDVVYFDAFGPDAQPELWTETVFKKVFNCMALGGVLTTFSSKGSVKRAMKRAGFIIEELEGPPGKRTITQAWKE